MQRKFRSLRVWQEAMDLVMQTYQLSNSLPESEKFGLRSQMRRAAVSVASNIAEGSARNSEREFLRFLYISRGSLAELETQLEITRRLGLMERNELEEALERLSSKLAKLIQTIKGQL